jgi:hypothetical protein
LAIRDPRILQVHRLQISLHFHTRFFLSHRSPLPAAVPECLNVRQRTCMHMHIAALQLEHDESTEEPASPAAVAGTGVDGVFHALVIASGPQARSAKKMLSFRQSKGTQNGRRSAGDEGATRNRNWKLRPPRPSRCRCGPSYQLIRNPHRERRSLKDGGFCRVTLSPSSTSSSQLLAPRDHPSMGIGHWAWAEGSRAGV